MGTSVLSIAAAIILVLSLRFMMAIAAAGLRVWRGGVAEAREFDRAGFGLKAFFGGRVSRQDSSSLVPTRAGIRVRMVDGRAVTTETRAVSKDVL